MTPAASANKAVLLYSGHSPQDNYHSVPMHHFSPGHHAHHNLDQLALHVKQVKMVFLSCCSHFHNSNFVGKVCNVLFNDGEI